MPEHQSEPRSIRDAFLGVVIAVAVAAPVSAAFGAVFASMAAWGAATVATIAALGNAVSKAGEKNSKPLKAEGDTSPDAKSQDEQTSSTRSSDGEEYDWRAHQDTMMVKRDGRDGCCVCHRKGLPGEPGCCAGWECVVL